MPISLTYMSRPAERFDEPALQDLLTYARAHNLANAVTGVLLYSGRCFLQTLEGPAEAVDETYDRICRDPRHYDLNVLWREEIEERLFGEWTMGYRTSRDEQLQGFVSLADHAADARDKAGAPGSRCLAFHRAFRSMRP